jgi:hypothetical protein
MSNMSYCRFENTYRDLSDCFENMENVNENNTSEKMYRKNLIELCQNIVDDYAEID